jgi:hypothetical protein
MQTDWSVQINRLKTIELFFNGDKTTIIVMATAIKAQPIKGDRFAGDE